MSKNNLKTIFVLLLMFVLSVPAFAVPGYEKKQAFFGGVPESYDISEQQAYFTKLEKQFFERHKDLKFSGNDYDREVTVPYLDFTAELQKKGYPGFIEY